MTLHQSQRRLAWVWLVGGGGIVVLMAVQGLVGFYHDQWGDASKWLMGTIFPNAGVMVGALAYSAYHAPGDAVVNPLAYRAASVVSLLYLGLAALAVLLQPLAPEGTPPTELMARASVILGPLQGLVGTALGAFFVSKQVTLPPDAPPVPAPAVT